MLNAQRLHEIEHYSMSQAAPGRIEMIVNIHEPSIEIHPVERRVNTGTTVILIAGGGQWTLNVGPERAFFANYGINTVILRNRSQRRVHAAGRR